MNPAAPLRYVDLSGYAFTGKHAVIDLLREFSGFNVAHFQFEFNLLRIQGGLRDLETALVNDWSPVRSNAAIDRFARLVRRLGTKNRLWSPSSWINGTGWNYDLLFAGIFQSRSEQYLNELVEAEWTTDWPFTMSDMGGTELFARKLLRLLGNRHAFDSTVRLSAPDPALFLSLTREYLDDLLRAFASQEDAHTVVMHNTFEPFNPGRGLRYFNSAKCIIVDRDPRDNYVAGLGFRPTQVSPEVFVRRYRMLRELASRAQDPPDMVLRINFEDLVMDYERTVNIILGFLKVETRTHIDRQRYFRPQESAKNIGIWRRHPAQRDIEYIACELREYCHER